MPDPNEINNRNPEIERESLIDHYVKRASDTYDFVVDSKNDIEIFFQTDYFSGKQIISSDTLEVMELAGFTNPQGASTEIVKSYIKYEDGVPQRADFYTGIRHYMDYVNGFENSTVLKNEAKKALKNNTDQFKLFSTLYDISPIIGLTVSTMYNQSRENLAANRVENNYEKWYLEAINSARDTADLVQSFFGNLISKINPNESLTKEFLNDWYKESLLPLFEAISLITTSARHSKVEDCAVYMSWIPVKLDKSNRNELYEKTMKLWETEILEDGRPSTYNQSMKMLQKYNLNHSEEPLIPIYVNVVDTISYVKFLNRYWSQLQDGLFSKKGVKQHKDNSDGNNRSVLKLGNAADVFIRPEQEGFAQARIFFEGTGNLLGFNIRVDKDSSKEELSVDFGSIGAEEAIAYAEEVKKMDAEIPAITQYSKLVNNEGGIKRYGRDVVSVMRSNARFIKSNGGIGELTDGNKASLLASIAMQEGSFVGLRRNKYFMYHSQEFINKPEYYAKFNQILKVIEKALLEN